MSLPSRGWLRFVFAALLVLSIGAAPTSAADEKSLGDRSIYDAVGEVADRYNEYAGALDLGLIERFLSDERVNAYVSDGDGVESLSFAIDGEMRITELRPDPRSDATIRLETDRATIERIVESDTPVAEAREAFADGDVTVTGAKGDVVSQATWTVVNAVVR
jgi:hypothetical protein